jgi:protein ImuA
MQPTKADIIAQLQRDILPLQGFKPLNQSAINIALGPLNNAFPNAVFPLGAIHEFLSPGPEHSTAAAGFIAGILGTLMQKGRASIWISASRNIFPPALKLFGIALDRMIFLDCQKEKDILWAMEEALKCEGLAAVIAETRDLGFTASRRLQLAVEQSRVTGFILRNDPLALSTTTCVARWKIASLPSELEDGLPGVGFPRWDVELIKIRNGKPGRWQITWKEGRFDHIPETVSIPSLQKKVG